MKKLTGTLLLCSVLLCSGCDAERETPSSNSESSSVYEVSSNTDNSESSTEESVSSSSDFSYATLLPAWEGCFPEGEINVIDSDGGETYTFQILGVTAEQRDAYIESCVEKDFKHGPKTWNSEGMENFLTNPDAEDVGANTWETGGIKHYEAYSGDKQYVLITDYHADEQYITVTVRYKG